MKVFATFIFTAKHKLGAQLVPWGKLGRSPNLFFHWENKKWAPNLFFAAKVKVVKTFMASNLLLFLKINVGV